MGCKDIGIKKSGFVAETQILCKNTSSKVLRLICGRYTTNSVYLLSGLDKIAFDVFQTLREGNPVHALLVRSYKL